MCLENITETINWSFADSFCNAVGSQTQLSGSGGRPTVEFGFTISRHTADTFKSWRDNFTHLQAEILYYESATNQCLIQIPNFIIETAPNTEDDINKETVTTKVARNGISTSYSNAYMTFNSPIKITVTNS
jgi:hypothetical protein